LMFDGAHEGKGITGRAPGIDRQHGGWMRGDEERAGVGFTFAAESVKRVADIRRIALEENSREAKCLRDEARTEVICGGDARDGVDYAAGLRRQEGEFGDGGRGRFIACGVEELLAGAPDRRIGLDSLDADESFKSGRLRGNACRRGFEKDIDLRRA